ncbi:MAG: IclR family transcriptional regulator [Caldimonas sp.]
MPLVVSPRRRPVPAAAPAAAEPADAAYTAPALEKGLDILELLAAENDGLAQAAIAQRLGRSTAELFRMLSVLARRGYLTRHSDGMYRLSMRLFELAHLHPPLKRLLDVALPAMRELAEACRQSNHLVIHFAGRILVVAQVDSPEPMGFGVRLGANFPFRPDRASSRVLSAFQPLATQDELIAELLANGGRRGVSAARMRDGLADIAAKGFYMAPSDTTTGVTDLCAPIFDHGRGAVAALTVPYLRQRDVRTGIASAREALLATVKRISSGLGAVRQG